MPKYDDWLKDFLSGKTEVPALELSDKFAVHSIRRFLEGKDQIWETAITYTGRLVVRTGRIGSDGISVEWEAWLTQHDVEMPKAGS
jgi:hypothetical protein